MNKRNSRNRMTPRENAKRRVRYIIRKTLLSDGLRWSMRRHKRPTDAARDPADRQAGDAEGGNPESR